jgi:hypothetical protein
MSTTENIIYLKINLLIGPKISFTYHYKIKNKNETPAEGDIVKINIKNRETWALIESIEHKPAFDTKEILDFFKISIDYKSFIDSLSKYYILEKTILNKKILSLFQ